MWNGEKFYWLGDKMAEKKHIQPFLYFSTEPGHFKFTVPIKIKTKTLFQENLQRAATILPMTPQLPQTPGVNLPHLWLAWDELLIQLSYGNQRCVCVYVCVWMFKADLI